MSSPAAESFARVVRAAATSRFLAAALAALVIALALPATRAAAQSATTVTGVVVSDSGAPLAGAVVRILWSDTKGKLRDHIVRSDDRGAFRVEKLTVGSYALTVQHPGFASYDAPFTLEAGGTGAQLLAELVPAPAEPASQAIDADAASQGWRLGFDQRRKGSAGRFLTRADIDRRRPRVLTEALRTVAGVTVDGGEGGERAIVFRANSVSACRPDIYLDGFATMGFSLDAILPSDVEGLEIYQSIAQTPVLFRATNRSCGAIVVWTRGSLRR